MRQVPPCSPSRSCPRLPSHRPGRDSSALQGSTHYSNTFTRARSDSIHTSDYSDDPVPSPSPSPVRIRSPGVYDDDSAEDDDFDPRDAGRSLCSPVPKHKRKSFAPGRAGIKGRQIGARTGAPVHNATCHATAVSVCADVRPTGTSRRLIDPLRLHRLTATGRS